jgi:hypothetical protein
VSKVTRKKGEKEREGEEGVRVEKNKNAVTQALGERERGKCSKWDVAVQL